MCCRKTTVLYDGDLVSLPFGMALAERIVNTIESHKCAGKEGTLNERQ